MKRLHVVCLVLVALCLSADPSAAQSQPEQSASGVISKSITAIGYQVGKGTNVILSNTDVMPQASGQAKVEAKPGITNIEVSVHGLSQPGTLSAELLTYVLWAASTEGRTSNLGEVLINKNGDGELRSRRNSKRSPSSSPVSRTFPHAIPANWWCWRTTRRRVRRERYLPSPTTS